LKGEHNDRPWAGKINDGSFIYSAGRRRPEPKVESEGRRPSSATASIDLCRHQEPDLLRRSRKDDPRVKKAFELDHKALRPSTAIPAWPEARKERGPVLLLPQPWPSALTLMGIDEITNPRRHQAQLARRSWSPKTGQGGKNSPRASGSTTFDQWMEGDPKPGHRLRADDAEPTASRRNSRESKVQSQESQSHEALHDGFWHLVS